MARRGVLKYSLPLRGALAHLVHQKEKYREYAILIWHIPYTFPFGGPDELMHLSMADYISKHLSWPRWDSLEVVRNDYGVSYNAGGSIVYWLHGLSHATNIQ